MTTEQSSGQAKDSSIRPALATFVPPSESRLRFAKQLGVDDVILWGNTLRSPDALGENPTVEDMATTYEELVQLRNRVENVGLRVAALENVPMACFRDVILGGDRREAQLAALERTIRNLGRAGIPYFGYNWMPTGVWRTSFSEPLRGGAKGTGVDLDDLDRVPPQFELEYAEDELWENYERFLRRILPVAEEAGVTLAPHPNDPPVAAVGGVASILRSFEAFQRAMDLVPSDNHGITLCLGNWSAMGADLQEVIRHFGEREKLCYVHFQTIHRFADGSYHETFVDQDHYYDPYEIISLLGEVGFEGVVIPGHVPQVEGDSEWRTAESSANTPYNHPMGGHRARAFTVGYVSGQLDAIRAAARASDD